MLLVVHKLYPRILIPVVKSTLRADIPAGIESVTLSMIDPGHDINYDRTCNTGDNCIRKSCSAVMYIDGIGGLYFRKIPPSDGEIS